MAVASLCHDNQRHLKAMQFVVHFLDNSEAFFDAEKKDSGQTLLDKVFKHLELHEKDYFGLQFASVVPNMSDAGSRIQCQQHLTPDMVNQASTELMKWIDPIKPIRKQIRAGLPVVLYFRVKFYVPDPAMLREEFTRYQYFLQLTKDMSEGRLVAPFQTTVLLASLAVQSELGDYCPAEHQDGYLNEFHFVRDQTDDLLEQVAVMHKKHRGLSPATCEKIYIDTARYLDTYGVHMFPATWDHSNEDVQLGVTSQGLAVFQNHVKTNTFTWSKIIKISFKRKQFFIHLRKEQSEHIETVFSFSVASYRSCKNLWKSCVEYHTFLCSRQCKQTTTSWMTDGQKQDALDLRYRSLECRHAGCSSASELDSTVMKQFPGDANSPSIASMLTSASNSLPQFDHNCDDSVYCMSSPRAAVDNSSASMAARETVLNRSNAFRVGPATNGLVPSQSDITYRSTASCQLCRNLHDKCTVRLLPTVAEQTVWMPSSSTESGNRLSAHSPVSTAHSPVSTAHSPESAPYSPVSADPLVDNSTELSNLPLDGLRTNSLSDQSSSSSSSEIDSNVVHDHVGNNVIGATQLTNDVMQVSCTDSDKSPTESSYDLPSDSAPALNLSPANQNLVTVHMKPDETGRFGFNVKGGSDQLTPVIVSRVAPNTPADLCLPRLTEGDQVLFINGRDISQHTHAQVVQSIKASCEMHSGELVLVVRQNVYLGDDDSPSEPDFQYIPDTPSLASVGGDPLTASMTMLKDGLDTGTTVAQFEQLYRKKSGMTMDASQLADNVSRNRYRDISPYDQTRVKLKRLSYDYINANYVNMEIPGSGIINRYIAAQGPLPETSHDFWEMMWEQRSSLVVMLTTNVERGRVKCHKYWPDVDETSQFEHLTVKCLTETSSDNGSYLLRHFTLHHDSFADDERQICQMQYMSWPDHGVPDDCSDFLDFVSEVRQCRSGVVESTVVHCSAGIGRTGVLIAMETAMCLIEANQTVSLPDIVCQMRDQRAMLIQTASQYKFVCEAVIKVFEERIVEPLEEFKR